MQAAPHVLIVGGNIAGLAAAIALREVGIGATVLERMPSHPAVPGGLHIASNGSKAAQRLGVGERLQEHSAPVERFQYRAPDGSLLIDVPAGRYTRRAGTTTFFVPRKEVTAALASALPDDAVRFGARVVRVDDDERGALVQLDDGEELRAAVVLGADGLRSAVRTQLFGEVPLRYAGYQDWGAVVPYEGDGLPFGEFWTLWGEGLRAGMAHVGDSAVYWAVSLPRPESEIEPPTIAELQERFGGWTRPIPELLAATRPEDVFGAPIADFAPRWPWTRGRIALVGDAAHATTPSAGRGASEALEDAVTVANALAAVRDFDDRRQVSDALAGWALGRARQTAAVTRLSRHIGSVGRIRSTPIVHTYLRATALAVHDKFRRDAKLAVPHLHPRPKAWTDPVRLEDLHDPREIVAYRLLTESAGTGDETLAYEVIAPDAEMSFHTLPPGSRGIEAFLSVSRNLRRGFPDLTFDIGEVTSRGDTVIVHDVVSGTHDGPFQGLPPTGRRFAVDAVHIFRFSQDKIVAGEVLLDTIQVPQQLGALPPAMAEFPKPLAAVVGFNAARRRRRMLR